MPCKADYSPAKSFYDVKNLSGLIYIKFLIFLSDKEVQYLNKIIYLEPVLSNPNTI